MTSIDMSGDGVQVIDDSSLATDGDGDVAALGAGGPPAVASFVSNAPRVRVAVRLHPDTNERVRYWASKHNVSANEYIVSAVEAAIRRENGDYDLPTLEQARLGQLIDEMHSLSSAVTNLATLNISGFDSLLGLVKGESTYLGDEDGELDEDGAV